MISSESWHFPAGLAFSVPAMFVVVVSIALAALGAWFGLRARRANLGAPLPPPPPPPPTFSVGPAESPPDPAAPSGIDPTRLDAANRRAAARLWRLAFGGSPQLQAAELTHARVRDNIVAVLEVDRLDPGHFPRRPALMSQLLQAVNDPAAASEKLSRIIAHDPVLTADVLRLANSGLYRMSPTPIETIQRALVVCGVDALRGMLATAMLRPAFRATRSNFPRLPRMLWERTERACRVAELFATQTHARDRFEAQLVVLLSALGPLVVYSAALDVYARNPDIAPSGVLCAELMEVWAPRMSVRIAADWGSSARLIAALERSADEPLTLAMNVGEFLGTLSFLESQTVITRDERLVLVNESGLTADLAGGLWRGLTGGE